MADFSMDDIDISLGDGMDDDDAPKKKKDDVDLTAQGFPEVTKRFEPTPHKHFEDPNYYKMALDGEGDIAKRVHGILQKYIGAKDPKDRSVFRVQLITAYWEFLRGVAKTFWA